MFLLGVAAWKLLKRQDSKAFQKVAKLAAAFSLVCVIGVVLSGDIQARVMDQQQPMKMAAAEALYNTQAGASFSVLTMWNLSGQPIFQLRIPHLLSLISDFSWDATVPGIHQLQAAESRRYGPGNYTPIVWVTYWSFRLMVGLGFLMLAVAGWAVWLARRRRLERNRLFLRATVLCIAAPFLANTFGWLLTEMGRQPWVVDGLMKTSQAISPNVGLASVAFTLAGFTALYTVLGAIDVMLVLRFARRPLAGDEEPPSSGHEPSLVY
jgi:cytochrome d ubiquinol oxidase subunit I